MSLIKALRIRDSIFSRSLLMVFVTVLTLTAINVGIVLFRPPPLGLPLNTYEIARLLNGQPVATPATTRLELIDELPSDMRPESLGDPVHAALAQKLQVPSASVRLERMTPPGNSPFQSRLQSELAMYGPSGNFNPTVMGPFKAAVKRPDGRWAVLSSTQPDVVVSWQQSVIVRFLLTLLVALTIAWIFARWLSRPIRSFAEAVESLGKRRQVEPVAVQGPAEIRQAGVAINEMQFRLQRYLAERTSMVAAIAHDLRTPLSRLQFHLTKASDDVRSKAELEIAEMEALIASTLDFVQYESRSRSREQVDLTLLVEGVVDDFADLGHNVAIRESVPATIAGDPVTLKRLFSNLISNAIVYGCSAEVSVSLDGEWVVVEIADRGTGMAQADIDRAFEPFYRAETSRNRSTGGIGLGLAIVQDAAAAHGGKVQLANRSGGGLSAVVRLLLTADGIEKMAPRA